MSGLHKLTILAMGQTSPWSPTIVGRGSWRATCSCERWTLTTWDRATVEDRWNEHVVQEGGLT